MRVNTGSVVCKGGLDQITPALDANPGSAAELLNYEVDIGGGFRRCDGYERFDGRTPPSSGWPGEWEYDLAGAGTAPDGETWVPVEPVTGNLEEAVTLCIPLHGLSLVGGIKMKPGGEFAILVHDGNQAHYTGQVYPSQQAFLDAIIAMPGIATAYVSEGSLCVESTVPMIPGVYPRLELLQWVALDDSNAQETLREAITGPPGFGPVWGVATFKGVVICARNFDEAGNDSRLYRSTPDGWEQIPMPAEARIGGARYSFINYNFYGDPAREALYGADGKNKAFEIKGDPYPGAMVYTEINTVAVRGGITYYPIRVGAHAMHLFLAFAGGWVQYSGIGNPFSDDPNDGAGGIAYAGEITNMEGLRDEALAISTRDQIFLLYGTSEADWDNSGLATQGDGIGGMPGTMVAAAGTFIADSSGIYRMQAVPAYGNFATAALSRSILPLYAAVAKTSIGAVPVRGRGIYRLYTQTGEWISLTITGESVLGFGYGKLPFTPQCVGYGTIGPTPTDQDDAVFLGTADGMVYRMDIGNSFDGEDIEAAIRFHFHNAKTPRQNKRWRKAVFEIRAPAQFPALSHAVFNYGGTTEAAPHQVGLIGLTSSAGLWNVSSWGEFYWIGKYIGEGEMKIDGHGRSVSLMLYSSGQSPAHVIEGYTVHYSNRGLAR